MLIQYENKADTLAQLLVLHQRRMKNEPLTTLCVLYCSVRSIERLPSFSCIKTLCSLKMNYCELVNLTGIEQFSNLRELEAKYNNIVSIDPTSKLKQLTELNLIGNPVCEDRHDYFEMVNEMLGLQVQKINGESAQYYVKLSSGHKNGFGLRSSQTAIHQSKSRSLLPLVVLPSVKSTFIKKIPKSSSISVRQKNHSRTTQSTQRAQKCS
jgi:hypothetical protein